MNVVKPLRRIPAESLFWVLPTVYLLEVILGGPVSLIRPLRFALFAGATASLLIAAFLFGRIRSAYFWPIIVVWAFLVFNLTWSSFVPMVKGGDMAYAASEVRGYLALILAVLFLVVAHGRLVVFRRLQKTVVVAAACLAVIQVSIWFVGTFVPLLQSPIRVFLLYYFGEGMYVGRMPDGFFRVFWISSLWYLVAIFWAKDAIRNRYLLWFVQGLLLAGVFVTYSRGIWVGLVAAGLVVHGVRLARRGSIRLVARQAVLAGAILVGVAGGLAAVGELERGVSRFTSSAETKADVSVHERVRQTEHLYAILEDNPFLGAGYGAYSTAYFRDANVPFSYENVPYALLAKLGVVGVAVFLGFFALLGLTALKGALRDARGEPERFCGSLVAFFVSAMTNPMLINFVGVSIFGCLIVHWAYLLAMRSGSVQAFAHSSIGVAPQPASV
jgi:hypothetical protein